jgi:hypothetical protein
LQHTCSSFFKFCLYYVLLQHPLVDFSHRSVAWLLFPWKKCPKSAFRWYPEMVVDKPTAFFHVPSVSI